MPPGFRLIGYAPTKSDLQIAWEGSVGVPTWTYEVQQDSLEEVERILLMHLGPEWHDGPKGSRRGEPNLILTRVEGDPRRVRIKATGDWSEPSALAQWAVAHLPLDRLGMVQTSEGGPIVDHFRVPDYRLITRRRRDPN